MTKDWLVMLESLLLMYQSNDRVSEQLEGMLSLTLICITPDDVFRETKTEDK